MTDKAAYDAEYRTKNKAALTAKKAAYYAANHDREKERAYRQASAAHHLEYCNTPEYRAWKREYDRVYRAKTEYGEFWECFMLAQDVRREAIRQAGGEYELLLAKGYFNRSTTKRRREYERLDREEPEVGPLGDLERHQRR